MSSEEIENILRAEMSEKNCILDETREKNFRIGILRKFEEKEKYIAYLRKQLTILVCAALAFVLFLFVIFGESIRGLYEVACSSIVKRIRMLV